MSHPPRAAAALSHPPLASAHLPHRPLTSTASPLASACIHRFAARMRRSLRPLLAYTTCRRSDPPFAAQVHFSPPRRATSPPSRMPIRGRSLDSSPYKLLPTPAAAPTSQPLDGWDPPISLTPRLLFFLCSRTPPPAIAQERDEEGHGASPRHLPDGVSPARRPGPGAAPYEQHHDEGARGGGDV
ncbi:hypothetical protein EJB05_05346, partial [Eragrostis curvula]